LAVLKKFIKELTPPATATSWRQQYFIHDLLRN
jgi:hypothetical protein